MPEKPNKKNKYAEASNSHMMPYEEFQKLQVTINEIDSWIEKSKMILKKSTTQLDEASEYLPSKKDTKSALEKILDQHSSSSPGSLNDLKWVLSFQPGNLLRIDTNITSIEELIEAAQKIRQLQNGIDEKKDCSNQETGQICNSPASTSSSSSTLYYQAAEYWLNALSKNPQVVIEDYKHCRTNLDNLLKDITPEPLCTILQYCWDCPHPQFGTDWDTFWNRSSDTKLNRLCTDSSLSKLFLHIMRHDRASYPEAQALGGYYYDRARDELMEYFDAPPNCALIEAIINLSVSCMVCKRYSKSRLYMVLGYRKWLEMGANHNEFKDDIKMRKKYLYLRLTMQFNDYIASYNSGAPCVVEGGVIDYREILSINKILKKNIKSKRERADFEKQSILDAFCICSVELAKIGTEITESISSGASEEAVLAKETLLTRWFECLPTVISCSKEPYTLICKKVDVLLKMQYESMWIKIHKGILGKPESENQHNNSREQCMKSASTILELGEYYDTHSTWCVYNYFLVNLYIASTVFCMFAMDKTGDRQKCKSMILRVMKVLESSSKQYDGMPDGMAQSLCEFLKSQNLHDDDECACNTYLKTKALHKQLLNQPQSSLDTNNDSLPILGFDNSLEMLSSNAEPL